MDYSPIAAHTIWLFTSGVQEHILWLEPRTLTSLAWEAM